MKSPNQLEVKKRCKESIGPIMAKHQLGKAQQISIDERGWVNPCMIVNDELVFRFNARDPHLPKFQREQVAFRLLENSEVPVPQILILDESKDFAPYDVMIAERLPGRNLGAEWTSIPNDQKKDLANQAGFFLKTINDVEFPFFGELSGRGHFPQTSKWSAYLEAKLAFHTQSAKELGIFEDSEIELFFRALQRRYQIVSEIKSAKLVHADYHLENLLYVENKITGVLDFEWAFAGDPLFDFCVWTQEKEEWPMSRSSFLKESRRDTFTDNESDRIALYQMLKNIELCVAAKVHFCKEEAQSFKETTLIQAGKL